MFPKGIAIDSMNTVYISDGYTVSVFNSKRQFIKCFKHKQKFFWLMCMYRKRDLAGLAVDYTGNLLQVLADYQTIAIF